MIVNLAVSSTIGDKDDAVVAICFKRGENQGLYIISNSKALQGFKRKPGLGFTVKT